jgi:hypothetical protein
MKPPGNRGLETPLLAQLGSAPLVLPLEWRDASGEGFDAPSARGFASEVCDLVARRGGDGAGQQAVAVIVCESRRHAVRIDLTPVHSKKGCKETREQRGGTRRRASGRRHQPREPARPQERRQARDRARPAGGSPYPFAQRIVTRRPRPGVAQRRRGSGRSLRAGPATPVAPIVVVTFRKHFVDYAIAATYAFC